MISGRIETCLKSSSSGTIVCLCVTLLPVQSHRPNVYILTAPNWPNAHDCRLVIGILPHESCIPISQRPFLSTKFDPILHVPIVRPSVRLSVCVSVSPHRPSIALSRPPSWCVLVIRCRRSLAATLCTN